MARYRYRVTQRLPWMEGGRPGPYFTWLGGHPVVYEPGTMIDVDERELVGNVVPCLEAVDDAGRAVLELARGVNGASAKRTVVSDFHPNARAWLIRATDETLRRKGRILELVLRMLERGENPAHADLHAATVQAGESVPPALKDHVFKVFREPQRPGPKHPRRSIWEDVEIQAHYQYELNRARHVYEGDSRQPRSVKDAAARATARAFTTDRRTLSKRTVERILAFFASRPWLRDDPSV